MYAETGSGSTSPAPAEGLVCGHGFHSTESADTDIRVSNGLATLGPKAVKLMAALEARFCAWAQACGADAYVFPPLMRVADLERFDYFQNFPHLLLCASALKSDQLADTFVNGKAPSLAQTGVPAAQLQDSQWALPSAACYNVYLHLQNQCLEHAQYVTTIARCFRNEIEYVSLRRLWGFTMREIVCVGSAEATQAHIQAFKPRILAFAESIGLPLTTAIATDPFFDQRASRAVMQRLFPVKEEFLYGGSLAIGSVNYHRNFFGERCQITLSSAAAAGQLNSPSNGRSMSQRSGTSASETPYASSSCVAFGLERWLFALLDHFGPDVDAIIERVEQA